MEPISSLTVLQVLAYLAPLSGPLPPHLLSEPLRQRHSFLGIGPEDPEEYLAWPADTRQRAVQLLQGNPETGHTHDEPFTVHYSVDPEHLFAHVRITPDIRLVFLWSNQHGWQYHNLDTMPFPANTYSNFDAAIAVYSPDDFLQEQPYDVPHAEDDDAYWDAYGADDGPSHNHRTISGKDDDPNSEDAYWAQYSRVHGSGDSTIPSPRPEKKKLDPDSSAPLPERIIVPSDDFQAHHVEPYNPFEAPSPESLARRLAALSSSSRAASPPLIDDAPTTDSEAHTPQLAEVPPPFDIPGTPPREHSLIPLSQVPASDPATTAAVATEFVVVDSVPSPITFDDAASNSSTAPDPAQVIIKENIQSLYRLWALNSQGRSPEEHKALFISTVRQALEEL